MTQRQRPSEAARWEQAKKNWETATMTDRYLFNRVMKDEDILLPTLKMLLPRTKISAIQRVDAEVNIEHAQDSRGYRLDIFATDDQEREYDIEMQVVNHHNLLQRSLAYSAAIVEEQLERGDPYRKLRPIHVIFLTKFDPFGHQDQYDQCEPRFLKHLTQPLQPPLLTFTYLNVAADQEQTPPALRRLCRFINSGTVDSDDPFILKLKQRQTEAKKNAKWRKIAMRINFEQQDREWDQEQLRELREQNQQLREKNQQIIEGLKQQNSQMAANMIKYFESEGDDHTTIITKLTQQFGFSKEQAEAYYQDTMTPA